MPGRRWVLAASFTVGVSLGDASGQTPPTPDPDGDDDPPADPGVGPLPTAGRFERVGRAPQALHRVCDLTVFQDALYGAHANRPLGSDGATVSRYDPSATPAFTTAFDWNRPGQPRGGGGAGQGFLRVHRSQGRLYVPDADPPYNGFGISESGTEGFVFVSDTAGRFAPARGQRLRPPGPPDAVNRPGAAVLPRAYHVLDTIRYRGRLLASTGSVPPRERAWYGPSPGALHVASADLSRWTYEVDYPSPWRPGVWRLGYLVRFRGRLYAGLQDYDGREPNDYLWLEPAPGAAGFTRADLHPVRVTGTALTLRWWADQGRLYWLAWSRAGGMVLRVTDDGDAWRAIPFPPEAGAPTDVTRWRGARVVLTERGLYRLDGDVPARLGDVPADRLGRSPFVFDDVFCAAPLAVFRGELYAGGQRDGSLWRFVAPSP